MDLILARSPVLLLLTVLLAAAFAWWSYGRMVPRPPRPQRVLLSGLRFGTFGLLLILLFEPILQRVSSQQEEPVVAVLLDDSRSMDPENGTDARAQIAGLLPELTRLDGQVRFFRFAGDVQPSDPDSLTFTGARTDISGALAEVQQRLARSNLRAVVLVSDGRYNTGRNPLYLAERFPVPINTVTLGDTTEPADVRIGTVVTNEIAYAGYELPVRVGIQATGFAGQRATVAISDRGQTLAQESVTLPEDGLEVPIELTFTPEEEGLRRFQATVTRFDGEATHANNVSGFTVRVLSARRSVLLLAAAPGPDLGFIRQELEAQPELEIVARTPRPDGSYYEGEFPQRLDEFDLIVLAGFPGSATPEAQARQVAAAIREGAPVLFALSRQTDLQKLAATLGDVLPARPEAVRHAFHAAQLWVPGAGLSHPVLQVPGVPAGELDRLPPIVINDSRWRAAPDARVLASTRIRGVDLDDPLLAVQRRGASRSAALLAASTWRWRNLPSDLDDLEPFYGGLLHNLVSWLTAHEDDRPVRVRPVQQLFDTTEPPRFTGQVYDEAMQPVHDAEVRLTIQAPDGTELPYPMRALGNGRYELQATTLPEGEYRYAVAAERQGVPLGEDRGEFAVGALDLELRHLTADPALMREVAYRSGGHAFFADNASGLAPAVAERMEARAVVSTRDIELWRLAPLLALLVGLLSVEWVMRKRAGMV